MELLFTSYSEKLATEIYKLDDSTLLGRHKRRDGTFVEFMVDDTPPMREILRKGGIVALKHSMRDFTGCVTQDTYMIKINDGYLTQIVYKEAYGEARKKIYMKERNGILDYRKSNLTLDIKDMVRSEAMQENRKKFVERTILSNPLAYAHKRMNAEYSGKLSTAISTTRRDRSTFTLEDVEEIREIARNGAKPQEIAESYGVARTTISDILYYRTWNVHEIKAEDIAPVEVSRLPQVPYLSYQDNPTKLHVDASSTLFVCDGFVYKFQQKVDVQVYLSKHLPTGELVADVHLTYTDKPRGANRYRNYVISYVRGNRLANYYMSKEDVYSILHSYMSYLG